MLSYVVGWPVLGAVTLALVGAGWSVLSMTPPRYRIAEVCFSVAVVVFLCKFAYWAITLAGARRERILVSFLVFGLTGLLFIEGIAWIEGMPQAHAVAAKEVDKEREQPLHVEPKVDVKVDRGKPSPQADSLAKLAASVGEIKSKIDKKPQREVEKDANDTAGAADSATIRKVKRPPTTPEVVKRQLEEQKEEEAGPILADLRIASQTRVVSTDNNLPYALEVVLQTNQSIQPVAFAIECNGEIGEGRAGFRSGGVYTKVKSGVAEGHSNVFIFEWDTPTFTADSPIVVTLLSRTGIRAIKLHKVDYVWP